MIILSSYLARLYLWWQKLLGKRLVSAAEYEAMLAGSSRFTFGNGKK